MNWDIMAHIGLACGIITVAGSSVGVLWKIMKVLMGIEQRLNTAESASKKAERSSVLAVRAARLAKKEAAKLHFEVTKISLAVHATNETLADIQSRSHRIRHDDPPIPR